MARWFKSGPGHPAPKHIDFLETEVELIDKVGLANYLQSQRGEGKETR